jgi:hypothetical protein
MRTAIPYLTFLFGIFIGVYIAYINTPKINLPEEYKSIDIETPILGYFDKDSVLHIEFDNSIQFRFAGEDKDIPLDSDFLEVLGTNENTVYLKKID